MSFIHEAVFVANALL